MRRFGDISRATAVSALRALARLVRGASKGSPNSRGAHSRQNTVVTTVSSLRRCRRSYGTLATHECGSWASAPPQRNTLAIHSRVNLFRNDSTKLPVSGLFRFQGAQLIAPLGAGRF